MPSTLSWLDFAESDRQRAMLVIDLFREKNTVDELGFAPIRDALADALFPGTSTIQTRAKYFLLVPWVMKGSERRKGSPADVAAWVRYDETRLMEALLKGGAKVGVIGSEAKGSLKRMPSSVYWRGLKLWQSLRHTNRRMLHRHEPAFGALSTAVRSLNKRTRCRPTPTARSKHSASARGSSTTNTSPR